MRFRIGRSKVKVVPAGIVGVAQILACSEMTDRAGRLLHSESAHAYPSVRTEIQFAGIGIEIRAFVVSVGVYRASQIDGITGFAVDLDLAVPDIASPL